VALKLQVGCPMTSHLNDIVRRLMELAALEERLATLKRDGRTAASVTALIESLRANIPLGVLITHDRMRSRDRHCVAEVRHGVCGGCHLALAVGNVAAVRHGDLHRCGNCGRYLFIVEEKEPAEAAPASATARSILPSPAESARLRQML
jgi:predicted  nucleic acid-binding Zn-ribbon protein